MTVETPAKRSAMEEHSKTNGISPQEGKFGITRKIHPNGHSQFFLS
jgi:hypothetical protein